MAANPTTKIQKRGTVLPPHDLSELLNLSTFLEQHTEPAALLGPDGAQAPLPMEVYAVLVQVVDAMRDSRAVTVAPVRQQLTTQEAADLLGISRPTVIKLIETGRLACEKPAGGRHRRILLSDVLDYQQSLSVARDKVLGDLVRDAEDDNLYDISYEEFQTAVKEARRERGVGSQ